MTGEQAPSPPPAGPLVRVTTALEHDEVSFETVSMVTELTVDPDGTIAMQAATLWGSVLDAFKRAHDGVEVCLMPPVGCTCLSPEGQIETAIFDSFEARFDWSPAWSLLQEVEAVAEEAQEWWAAEEQPPQGLSRPERIQRAILMPVARASRMNAERSPHSRRAFSLISWLLKTVEEENSGHAGANEPASPMFAPNLGKLERQLASNKQRLRDAMQRSAQTRYWYGAVVGFGCLLGLCLLLAVAFGATGTPAWYGVAVPAGGIGAMVSLLQRMSSGGLKLDLSASRNLLTVFGAVRTFIGAVFGIIISAALIGGLIPSIHIPAGRQLAFFGAIGFLAGFNERWAQDMLKSTADQLQPPPAADPAPAPSALPPAPAATPEPAPAAPANRA